MCGHSAVSTFRRVWYPMTMTFLGFLAILLWCPWWAFWGVLGGVLWLKLRP